MLLNSAIFRGGLRFRCSYSEIILRSLGNRCIFYPSGPFPTHPQTSRPHPEAKEGPTPFSNAVFDGLIGKGDVDKSRSTTTTTTTTTTQTRPKPVASDSRAPGPYDGRTVHIKHDITITSAWNILNAILRKNYVRRELRLTARHEQKGEKRRRLRRERWRRRFAHEVRMKVKLVMEMRNRDRMWGAKH